MINVGTIPMCEMTIWLNRGWFDQRKYPRIYEIIYDTMELLISSSGMALYVYIGNN